MSYLGEWDDEPEVSDEPSGHTEAQEPETEEAAEPELFYTTWESYSLRRRPLQRLQTPLPADTQQTSSKPSHAMHRLKGFLGELRSCLKAMAPPGRTYVPATVWAARVARYSARGSLT